ncbi:MAG TPA: pyruvate dehydrogenase complex dihydrolipoamide acetyltransferase [Gemmatimonadaceae bacterium]|nr:pyruvate dehydrogenase complex dihydrolipoamide acetyltransferase [Gemmatimonadaceae bacterium]
MATKVVMEALSPTMEEGRLVKWNKAEGEKVAKGDVLAEVETDKAVMELVARGDGVLRKRLAAEGETRPVGDLLAVIGTPDEDIAALVSGGAAAPAATAPAPKSAPAPAPVPSVPRLGNAAPPPKAPPMPEPPTEQPRHAAEDADRPRSSPLARRLASDSGLELAQIQGSGPGGRIIKRDIEAAMQRGATPTRAPSAEHRAPSAESDFDDVPLTQIRKTIAKRLAESIGPVPTFYLTAEFDLSRVAEMRAAMADLGDEYKVSFNDIVLKATATALAMHPEVNAHWLGDRIRKFNRVHLGMAVAIPDGLITPVIFDADRKRLSEIARESRELAARARDRKLAPEEYTGSTFSVSNLGMFGIDQFTAIINPPEAGILAIGAVADVPVAEGGALAVRKHLRVTMSCDHRVIDGATGARFLQTLRRLLENPLMLVF